MGRYLDIARQALEEEANKGSQSLRHHSNTYERNELNEIRPVDPIVDAFHDSFPPGVDSIPFNQPAMDAIKAGYAVRVWSGVVDEWLYWVRGEVERAKLIADGVVEPIYTLGELALVAGLDMQSVKTLHALKREMGAVIHPTSQDDEP